LTSGGIRRRIADIGELCTPIVRIETVTSSKLAMPYFRRRLSDAVAWVMIPLAAWAGMPSTACLCANGHVKLFCQHALGEKQAPVHPSPCGASCCTHETVHSVADDGDCCGGGFCCHGGTSEKSGIGSKACCQPILSSPSVAPQIVSVPCDPAPAIVGIAEQIGALVHPAFIADLAEINTGPPLDRVIVFRSLLI
jgi:hypothetical protein